MSRTDLEQRVATYLAIQFMRLMDDVSWVWRTVRDWDNAAGLPPTYGSDSNGSGESPRLNEETRELLRDFLTLRKFVVHRHFPSRPLGGAFGWLDFGQKPILRSIEMGFHDAVHHDCEKNGCIV